MNDAELIAALGGSTRVAALLDLPKGGAQRVQNWITRGIPSRMKLDHPDVLLRPSRKLLSAAAGKAKAAGAKR
jgi:hypothetical protein